MKLHEESSALENPYGTEWTREREADDETTKTFSMECCYVGMEATAHFSPWRSNNVSCTFFKLWVGIGNRRCLALIIIAQFSSQFSRLINRVRQRQWAGVSHIRLNDAMLTICRSWSTLVSLEKLLAFANLGRINSSPRNIRRFMTIRECSVLAQEHKSQL